MLAASGIEPVVVRGATKVPRRTKVAELYRYQHMLICSYLQTGYYGASVTFVNILAKSEPSEYGTNSLLL